MSELWLGKTQIGDEGLVHVRGLKNLWLLDLSNTRVTDVGLGDLKELLGLRLSDLRVRGSKATPRGLYELERSARRSRTSSD